MEREIQVEEKSEKHLMEESEAPILPDSVLPPAPPSGDPNQDPSGIPPSPHVESSSPANQEPAQPALKNQVRIYFKAVGNAPIMKKKKFVISCSKQFHEIISWLRVQLKIQPSDSLFVYINGAFAPSPDESLSSLYECFQIQGELIVNYSLVGAWG
mmetsp:Transcript_15077/g.19887  ORF Transcript_15077/g.19887 Transcript_15077/m.19887 type:complete len:156 (-) Transcript_15077:429-896(-)|eukprot:CAMPEP_0117757714 /NCGR_PEP_ID=MMETSP0947-20121206/14910_1 /TAXON_ID=44440 /ORGANISM="Chattonella subsalsa, Strain CCMP2191" /LENGTH=155 /DNA_ID=CAMNT_0005577689 /DNA_START=84 /DNA_END=551 /DNA_ORIENTATION=-